MKVWTTNNLTDIVSQNKLCLASFTSDKYLPESNFRVGIIGGGPKGAYSIERLASVWNSYGQAKFLDIVCFNKTADFASGPNYRTDQPDFLLMNYSLGNVDFRTDENEQLIYEGLNLQGFLKRFRKEPEMEVKSSDYCSRAVTGIYLQYCLCKVLESLPPNIRLHLIVDEVTSIEELSAADGLMVNTQNGMQGRFAEVICCTGHSYSFGAKLNTLNGSGKPEQISGAIIQSVYPVQHLQEGNYAGKTVAIKGMGLTFVDAVLAITEGKGGRFIRENGRMSYKPSGKEPKEIIAFSRTGLPMIARQNDFRKDGFSLKYFTEESAHNFSKHDFKLQLLPLIHHEFKYQYVAHLLRANSDLNIHPENTLYELEAYAVRLFPDFTSFDLEQFLSPKLPSKELHNTTLNYLEETVFPENFGALHQSKVAMSALWREIYPIFNKLYSFGKLSGESQRYFDQHYLSRFQRVSYGPPKENMEKIIVLAEAEILGFDLAANPKVLIQHQPAKIKISNEQMKHPKIVNLLIDARIPKSRGFATQPEYIKKLVKNMGVDFFTNENYKTGCLEMDTAGRLKKLKNISFYGLPTEGWTLDNESLSRSNNNFLAAWAKQIVQNYANINHPKINATYPSVD